MTGLARQCDANVRVNWGRWISPCQGVYCLNAWQMQVGEQAWVCNLCRHFNEVSWPADPAAVEWLLMMRPDVTTRNWEPHETLDQLLMENVAHGIVPREITDLVDVPGGHDILVVDGGLTTGGVLLPGIRARRRELVQRALAARNRRALPAITEV